MIRHQIFKPTVHLLETIESNITVVLSKMVRFQILSICFIYKRQNNDYNKINKQKQRHYSLTHHLLATNDNRYFLSCHGHTKSKEYKCIDYLCKLDAPLCFLLWGERNKAISVTGIEYCDRQSFFKWYHTSFKQQPRIKMSCNFNFYYCKNK